MTNAHIITHTHWDREWYKSYEHFRTRLVYFMDNLIDLLEDNENFQSFLFDGQTVILEDYLSIRPENEPILKKLIQDKKIIVGPWYIQPDEFSPDGEALIRNLLIGIKIGEKFGPVMKIGYLPDSFGHTCQLPQILKGFGIDSVVGMRGVPFSKINSSEFEWRGLNGDVILGVYLKEGYFNACFLPEDYQYADERVFPLVEKLKDVGSTGNILLMNGIDHQWPQKNIAEYIKHLNEIDKETNYIHSSLEEYIKSVEHEKPQLQRLEGDLIAPENSRTHTSMASTRVYQKKRNREEQNLVERYVEPISSMGWIFGAEYPSNLIELEWKYIIKNHAHDSICGCCTDRVHRQIDERFESANDIGTTLLKTYSRAIARAIGRNLNSEDLLLLTFNNSMVKGKQLVNGEVIVPYEGFELYDMEGRSIPYQIEEIEEIKASSIGIWSSMGNFSSTVNRIKFSFYVDFPFNFGYLIHKIVKREDIAGEVQYGDPISIDEKDHIIENKFFKVKIYENGTLDILDKQSNKFYRDLNVIEDCGDEGDTYNYSPVKYDQVITSLSIDKGQVELLQKGPIKVVYKVKYDMKVPYKLDGNRRSEKTVDMPIETFITIYRDIKRVDIRTIIDNRAYDHRVRALFGTGINVDHSFAETQFGVIKRENKLDDSRWEIDKWSEKPLPIYYQQKFVDINDGNHGLAILNRGIPEYEVYERDENIVAITLIRGIGDMGKKDLAIRPGRASGVEMKCPEAQCMGVNILEYSIVPHLGDIDAAKISEEAFKYVYEPYSVQNILEIEESSEKEKYFNIYTLTDHIMEQIKEIQPRDYGLIDIDDDNILISAIKKAEEDESLILRLYNSSSREIEKTRISIDIERIKEIWLCNLGEEELEKIDIISKGEFEIQNIKPYTVITLKLKSN